MLGQLLTTHVQDTTQAQNERHEIIICGREWRHTAYTT